MKAPEITEEDKLKAAVETQKNSIKTAMVDLWRRLQVGETTINTLGAFIQSLEALKVTGMGL